MKKAVIVVGSNHVGKSKTINLYLKKRLGLSVYERKIRNTNGYILSQSLEEKFGMIISQSLEEKDIKDLTSVILRYKDYNRLVIAARPEDEKPSVCKELKNGLENEGFKVHIVRIKKTDEEKYYDDKGKVIYELIK
jgi:hypothetical protein